PACAGAAPGGDSRRFFVPSFMVFFQFLIGVMISVSAFDRFCTTRRLIVSAGNRQQKQAA
ncbi:MAG: hypothetical protein NUV34_11570, partial [Sulfuricaulis sp.]|nr:hypothetical protein [Sulfuricaulis sp.]